MIMDIIKIFCNFDDFCKNAEVEYQKDHPTETPEQYSGPQF